MRYYTLPVCLFICGAAAAFPRQPQPGTTTWGYVEAVDGQAVTLDDGTVLRVTDKTQIIRLDGTPGTIADVVKSLKAVATIADDGALARLELLRRPNWQETYLATVSAAGANVVSATVGGKAYPRSLSLVRASFLYRNQYSQGWLEGDVTYQPDKGTTAPPKVRFAILSEAGEVCFERSAAANEVTHFRVNFSQGDRTFTLLAEPQGAGRLRPQSCVWLDPRFAGGPATPAGGFCIYQQTTRRLLEDLRQCLGQTKVEKVAISQFGNVRVSEPRALDQLQEDLVVLGTRYFDIVGPYQGRVELGNLVTDAQKAELQKLGAKFVLSGTVSDRGDLVVVNVALVNVENNAVVATARATQ